MEANSPVQGYPKQRYRSALERHIERLGRRLEALEQTSRRYSWARLGVAVVGGLAAVAVYQTGRTGLAWSLAALLFIAFCVLVYLHRRVLAGIRRHLIWRRIKATHIARMSLDWPAIPLSPASAAPAGHPFAGDLNLAGPRSLHHLLDTAVARGGSTRLLGWLLDPVPDLDRVRKRQTLVGELQPLSAFRDRLTLAGALVAEAPGEQWDGERLLGWLDEHDAPFGLMPTLKLLGTLAVVNVVLVALHVAGILPPLWAGTFLLYGSLYLYKHNDFGAAFDEAFYLERTLRQFGAVMQHVEESPFGKRAALAELCAPFRGGAARPSAHLKRIVRIASLMSIQHNEIVGPLLNALMPWDLFFTYRLHQAKARVREALPGWLKVWYELEAACSLATFADLNPEYRFPEVSPAAEPGRPVFEARALGHPLLPDAVKVRNDFSLADLGAVIIVTGSNMSGKSTFLRTLGVGLCLAYAGGPVDAARFRTLLFRPFTCIQVSDSVNDGISYFYAEVRRLKALLEAFEADHPLPLFFLIDEIFRGTNNRERLIGSRAFIHALAGGHGAGLIATHDLELVHLADTVPGVANYHFREEVRDGRMVFDYHLHHGPCPTTNALKIMQMEGLPVQVPGPHPTISNAPPPP